MQPPKIIKHYSDSVILLNEFVREMEKVYGNFTIDTNVGDEMFHVKRTYRKAKKLLKDAGYGIEWEGKLIQTARLRTLSKREVETRTDYKKRRKGKPNSKEVPEDLLEDSSHLLQ